MRDLDSLFAAMATSAFRRTFRLSTREQDYLGAKGLAAVLDHGRDIVARRLAPARPTNDGKQTPFRGHPVFVAQHATATCCRGCLEKWHHIPRGRALTAAETARVLDVLARWLSDQPRSAQSHAQAELPFDAGPRAPMTEPP